MPPPSQSEPATRQDLEVVAEQRLLATLRGEMISHTRTMVYANMAAVFSGVSLAFVAARLS